MSREDYVAIGARLFAVYVGITTIMQIPYFMRFLGREDDVTMPLWAASLLVVVLVCVALWFFPLTIARKLLPVMKEPRSEQAVDASVGLSLGLTLIGVWFFAEGLLSAVHWVTFASMTRHANDMYAFSWDPDQVASMALTGFQIVLGALLMFGSSWVKKLIYRLRYGVP